MNTNKKMFLTLFKHITKLKKRICAKRIEKEEEMRKKKKQI